MRIVAFYHDFQPRVSSAGFGLRAMVNRAEGAISGNATIELAGQKGQLDANSLIDAARVAFSDFAIKDNGILINPVASSSAGTRPTALCLSGGRRSLGTALSKFHEIKLKTANDQPIYMTKARFNGRRIIQQVKKSDLSHAKILAESVVNAGNIANKTHFVLQFYIQPSEDSVPLGVDPSLGKVWQSVRQHFANTVRGNWPWAGPPGTRPS